jgi:hypothetical protein
MVAQNQEAKDSRVQWSNGRGPALILSFNALRDALRGRRREEAVQGAGMVGPFQAQGAAESDASVRLGVRSHVPGTRRDRAQAEAERIRKAKPSRRLLPKESAYGPSAKGVRPMNRRRSPANGMARGSAARRLSRSWALGESEVYRSLP